MYRMQLKASKAPIFFAYISWAEGESERENKRFKIWDVAKHHRKRWTHIIKIIYQIRILIRSSDLLLSPCVSFSLARVLFANHTQYNAKVIAWWKRKRECFRSNDKKIVCVVVVFFCFRHFSQSAFSPFLPTSSLNMICHTSPFCQVFFLFRCNFSQLFSIIYFYPKKVSFTRWEKILCFNETTSTNVFVWSTLLLK